MMNLSDAQKQRQQLLRQLTFSGGSVSDSNLDTELRHAAEGEYMQQLEECAVQENRFLIELYGSTGHEVSHRQVSP